MYSELVATQLPGVRLQRGYQECGCPYRFRLYSMAARVLVSLLPRLCGNEARVLVSLLPRLCGNEARVLVSLLPRLCGNEARVLVSESWE